MRKKTIIITLVVFSAAWLIAVCTLATRFNVPSGDAIMYSLPLAVARHPFDLGIPFLNNFDGYGSAWGHHWPGSMWIKGCIFMIIPYSRVADVAVLSVFQLVAAFAVFRVVWNATLNGLAASAAFVVILSDRLLILNCAGNRFEPIAVAVLLLMFANLVTPGENRRPLRRLFTCFLAFICPTLHPYALFMGALIIGFECLESIARNRSLSKNATLHLAAFAGGCAAMAAWYYSQPDALRQFTTNLALQKSFYQHGNTVFEGLKNYRVYSGLVLWAGGLIASLILVTGWHSKQNTSPAWRFLAPALFIAVIAIHTAVRCENFSYLAMGSPFAVLLVFAVLGRTTPRDPIWIRGVAAGMMICIAIMHGVLIPHKILQFRSAGFPNIHREISRALEEIPPTGKVYVPALFWASTVEDKTHEIRWSSFPLASARQTRERYEKIAYADAKAGDRLIVDNGAASQPDRFGGQPTFQTLPPDPSKWRLFENRTLSYQGSIPWGIDFSIYEYR